MDSLSEYNFPEFGIVSSLVSLMLIISIISIIVLIICYVFVSIAVSRLCRHVGYDKVWMAWIPFVRNYAVADIALWGEDSIDYGNITVPGFVLKFWWILGYGVAFIPIVGYFLFVLIQVLATGRCWQAIYAITENRSEDETLVIGYLSGLIGFIAMVKCLRMKSTMQ